MPNPAKRFQVADVKHLRIAARRLGRQRGTTGFGNARAVRNAYEQAQRRQSARVLKERGAGGGPDPLLLLRDDLLGPKHLDVSSCSALRELKAMRGLDAVKQAVRGADGVSRLHTVAPGSSFLTCAVRSSRLRKAHSNCAKHIADV